MTGYVEILTDPSYRGQIMVFSSPTIANYPWIQEAMESGTIQVSGAITRDSHSLLSGGSSLDSVLSEYQIPGIDLVDTRTLILKIRERGVMKGFISDSDEVPGEFPDPMLRNLVSEVAGNQIMTLESGKDLECLVLDTGAKKSLMRRLSTVANLTIVPFDKFPHSRLNEFDFVFLPNGPGDPSHESLQALRGSISDILGTKPVIGVCLGHQIISLAAGCSTYKMKYGHRGGNHSVTDGTKTWMTAHNHGYAVSRDSMRGTIMQEKQWDINDRTVEMIGNPDMGILTTQYHPEGAPGPHDMDGFFDTIGTLVRNFNASR